MAVAAYGAATANCTKILFVSFELYIQAWRCGCTCSAKMQSSTDYRRAKELEEARKAGLAPAEVDEDGREINPHIPQYMTSAPWYLNKDKPTLQHQRDWRQKGEDTKKWYDRGVKVFQATKYRKGACENCGSMTHKTKDCLERPRSKGAKWTNKNIAADDKVEDIHLISFDAKRDRWNGFDAKEYSKVIERYEQIENIRKEMKQKEKMQKMYKGEAVEDGPDDVRQEEDEEDKILDDQDAGFAEVKKRVRTTAGGATGSVRNLRIREDTAKYLLNLDPNSAHYDPKSRSMREDPNPDKTDQPFHGDNFVRKNGDYAAWQNLQLHALTAFDKGQDVHMQANPSLAEMLYKQFKEKKEALAVATKTDIKVKYGSAAEPLPEELKLLAESERYVEYDRMGRVVKGQETKARSRYEEDVYINNHTSVWGSWWRDGTWGYACCHQTVKNSYCTGKAGEHAAEDIAAQLASNMEAKAQAAEEENAKREQSKLQGYQHNADVWGAETAAEAELDPKKVDEALKRLYEREKDALAGDKDKRKFNSLDAASEDVTPEEMEAYRLKKARADDPMAALVSSNGVSNQGYDYL